MKTMSAKELELAIHSSVNVMSRVIAVYDQVLKQVKLRPDSFSRKNETTAQAAARLERFRLMTSRLKVGLRIITSDRMTSFTIKKLELLLKYELKE